MADHENRPARKVARQCSKKAVNSQRDIRIALAAGRTIIIFADQLFTLRFLRIFPLNPLLGYSVENAKFFLPYSLLIDDLRCVIELTNHQPCRFYGA